MSWGNTSKSPSEKGRPAGEPGAKEMGTYKGATGNPSRSDYRGIQAEPSFGKNSGSLAGQNRGNVPARNSGRLPVGNPHNSSELRPLGRTELIEEWQTIILPFPIKQVAEQQDATTRAIESQRNGDSAASLLAAINMARANPRVRAQLGRLMGFTGAHTDPDFMQAMELIGQSYIREQFSRLGASDDDRAPQAQAMGDSSEDASEDEDSLTGDLFAFEGSA